MAILFFILRLIGWVLLAILLLLVVALLLPLGIQAAYRPGEAFAKAFYGPLKFTLWPRGGTQGAQSKAKSKPTQKSPEKPDTSPPPTVIKTVEGEKASVTIKVEPDKSALPAQHKVHVVSPFTCSNRRICGRQSRRRSRKRYHRPATCRPARPCRWCGGCC